MQYAAFIRNVTLGRTNSFSKDELQTAFLDAGSGFAQSFLASGNLIFEPGKDSAKAVMKRAMAILNSRFNFTEPVYLRDFVRLKQLLDDKPFAQTPTDNIYERCITFLPDAPKAALELPIHTPRGDLDIFRADGTEVFSVTRRFDNRPGNPTAVLEKLLGLKVTTRNWNTVVRLLKKFG